MRVFHCRGSVSLALTVAGLAACTGCQPSGRSSGPPGSDPTPQSIAEDEGKQLTRRFEGLTLASSYGCAVEDDASLWCWGDDPASRLGLRSGDPDPHQATQVSGLGPVAQVVSARVASHQTTCALLQSAEVHCWGTGFRGEKIGIHRVEGLANVEQLAAQRDVCARTSEGAVYCWTPSDDGKGGKLQRILDGAIDIASGYMNCALDAAGAVRCWGGGTSAKFKKISRMHGDRWKAPEDGIAVMAEVEGAVEVDVGVYNFCVRRTSGDVLCALPPGAEDFGKPPLDLEPISGTDGALDLSLSEQHSCAVTRDGGVRCWGSNAWAQLGDGSSTRRDERPVTVSGLENIRAVAAADTQSCALGEDGISCWGTSAANEFDRRATETQVLPFQSREIRAVEYLTCALGEDGKTRCWGPHAAHTTSFSEHKFGADAGGVIAASTPTELPLQLGGISALYNSPSICLLDADHTLICGSFEHPEWKGKHSTLPNQTFVVGSRETGVLGMDEGWGYTLLLLQSGKKPQLEARTVPQQHNTEPMPAFHDVIDFAVEYKLGCVAHGQGVVDCWHPYLYAKKKKTVHRVPGLSDAAGIVDFPSASQSCAWTRQGKVVCWRFDQPPDEFPPPEMSEVGELGDVVELAASSDELCARQRDGSLACAPHDRESIGAWQRVDVPPVVQITAGDYHICMIHEGGETRCIGDNRYGQLGGLSARTVPRPTPIVFAD